MKWKAVLLLTAVILSVCVSFSNNGSKNKQSGNAGDDRKAIVEGDRTQAAAESESRTNSDQQKETVLVEKDEISASTAITEESHPSLSEVPFRYSTEKEVITLRKDPYLPKPDTSYVTEEMLQNAVLSEGDLTRLVTAMRKAQNGEEITVGVIGGSITQGLSTTDSQYSFGNLFYEWWLQAFPQTKVNYVNAGIGATNSYLGVHRVDKDLLVKKPDVVIVEFSVNDSDNEFYQASYEDLIRKLMKSENSPAVILLFMTMEDGTSAELSHSQIGYYYDLPQISYRQSVLKEIRKGTFRWKDISPDNIHPNNKGHAIAGELLWNYLNYVYAKQDTIINEVQPLKVKPLFQEAYKDATILNSKTLLPVRIGSFEIGKGIGWFKNSWNTSGGDKPIVFELEAQNIGILYYRTPDNLSGQIEVYIDGEYNCTLDADYNGGRGNYYVSTEVYRSEKKGRHRIELRRAKTSEKDKFCILGLLIS